MNTRVVYFSVLLWTIFILKVDGQSLDEKHLQANTQIEDVDFYHLKTAGGMEQNSITSIAQDSIGQMWFATKNGLVRCNAKEFFVYKHNPDNPHSIGNNFVNSIFVSKDGSIWVASIGLAKYHSETDEFEPIVPTILSDIEIYAISQDTTGILWFIDRNSTLYRYDDIAKELQSFEFKTNKNHYVKSEFRRLLVTKNDRIFITTNQPYFLEFTPSDSSFNHTYFMSEREIETLPNYRTYAISIEEDHNGHLWIASRYGYVMKYDLQKDFFIRHYFNLKFPRKDFANCTFIFEDTSFNIWIGTWFNGLLKISPDRREIQHFLPELTKETSLTNNIITSGFQDKAGYLWFGTEFAGLNILKKNKKFSVFTYNSEVAYSLPAFPYTAAVKDLTGRVWVGTDGDGLYYFNPKDKKAFKTDQPILKKPTRIFTLLNGKNDNLWIGTGIGLYQYD